MQAVKYIDISYQPLTIKFYGEQNVDTCKYIKTYTAKLFKA